MLTRVKRETCVSGNACSRFTRSPPTLGEMINDMVTGLGGLCSGRNPFLFLLLKALGFDNVTFVSGTMCGGVKMENAHIALLVCVDSRQYWVDIANGFPYLEPVLLDNNGEEDCVIKHPFVSTRLVKKQMESCEVYFVQHQFHRSVNSGNWICGNDWIDNYHFQADDSSISFASMF